MKAAHKSTEGQTLRQVANMALKAMDAITGCDNGTIRNPFELASSVLPDGRTLIEAIYSGDEVRYKEKTTPQCATTGQKWL